jgi:hypothetical protein
LSRKNELEKIPHAILEETYKAGMEADDKNRSATFYHIDQSTVYSRVNEFYQGKIELMDTKAALQKYSWLKDYMWKLVDKDKDEFTRKVAED